jgi:hypothetical protein
MSKRQFICIECNFCNGSSPNLITDGFSWRGENWWRESGHCDPEKENDIVSEIEHGVEVADMYYNDGSPVTMTTIAISFPANPNRTTVHVNGVCVPVIMSEKDGKCILSANGHEIASFHSDVDADLFLQQLKNVNACYTF